jgi:hypothetical protein
LGKRFITDLRSVAMATMASLDSTVPFSQEKPLM